VSESHVQELIAIAWKLHDKGDFALSREVEGVAERIAAALNAQAGVVEALTEPERKALEAAMQNAEHEAGDVEDVCPRMDDDEDAYWAWHKYHGLRKALAAVNGVGRE
jgi:tRNA(Ile2) C34 agmatinyltransferase TiaS